MLNIMYLALLEIAIENLVERKIVKTTKRLIGTIGTNGS